MALTAQQMVDKVKYRTHHTSDTKIVAELISAQDLIFNKIFKSAKGPDQLSVQGQEISIASRTREYDLGAQITGTLYGVKLLWLKFSTDTTFTPMQPADTAELKFIFDDQWAASDTTTVADGHPVLYDIVDWAKVRFSPPLPSGCTIRADSWLKAPNIDPAANNVLAYGDDIIEPTHEAIVSKATSQIFVGMDDDRWRVWDADARERINDALFVLDRRTGGPTRTKPFRSGHRRWI